MVFLTLILHMKKEETGAQRGRITCPRSFTKQVKEKGFQLHSTHSPSAAQIRWIMVCMPAEQVHAVNLTSFSLKKVDRIASQ